MTVLVPSVFPICRSFKSLSRSSRSKSRARAHATPKSKRRERVATLYGHVVGVGSGTSRGGKPTLGGRAVAVCTDAEMMEIKNQDVSRRKAASRVEDYFALSELSFFDAVHSVPPSLLIYLVCVSHLFVFWFILVSFVHIVRNAGVHPFVIYNECCLFDWLKVYYLRKTICYHNQT